MESPRAFLADGVLPFFQAFARAFSVSRSASKLKPATQRSARSSEGQWTSVESPSCCTMKLRADSSPSSAGSGRATRAHLRDEERRVALSTVQAQRARPRVSVPARAARVPRSRGSRWPCATRPTAASTSRPPRAAPRTRARTRSRSRRRRAGAPSPRALRRVAAGLRRRGVVDRRRRRAAVPELLPRRRRRRRRAGPRPRARLGVLRARGYASSEACFGPRRGGGGAGTGRARG